MVLFQTVTSLQVVRFYWYSCKWQCLTHILFQNIISNIRWHWIDFKSLSYFVLWLISSSRSSLQRLETDRLKSTISLHQNRWSDNPALITQNWCHWRSQGLNPINEFLFFGHVSQLTFFCTIIINKKYCR